MAMALPHCAMVGRSIAPLVKVRKVSISRRVTACAVGEGERAALRQARDISNRNGAVYARAMDSMPPEGFAVLMSCGVGLLTGIGVVAFNYTVHEIHDIVWHGVPRVTWFRSQPLAETWKQIMIVPVGGGFVVGLINFLQSWIDRSDSKLWTKVQALSRPLLKSVAAAVTLGTANSLGPEGPSVEIGASVGNGIGSAFRSSRERTLALKAAGSAAGISSGFNAAVAGCFFAVESVLKSSLAADSAGSLTTAMVILSSVLATVVSQAGLGSDPAFKIPSYDFRSPAELPLYLVLGVICGGLSISLTKCSAAASSLFDNLQKSTGIPSAFLPPLGGLCVAVIALAYPEVLYWGFENVDAILESRPWARGPPADLLFQIVAAKVVATSLCRGSRLVGGFYAPSLFIGASLGSAYGKLAGYIISHANPMYHLDALEVAAPQAYALVGMAAVLAGVCQVPFTSILLLFELTRDYRIILPLMAAVGLSSWIASSYISQEKSGSLDATSSKDDKEELCYVEESLCVTDVSETKLAKELLVSAAVRENYLAVTPDANVEATLFSMLREKKWCALVIGSNKCLEGILTLGDIQEELRKPSEVPQKKVSDICRTNVVTAKLHMNLESAQRLLANRGLRQLPVLSEDGQVVGIIDQDAIKLACRVEATKKLLPMQ
ncbi:chloride channel protein CLC-e [Selaginella moellendorffii]|uniref:chloride channel protein CLC-e n=1 Tax=Selaginella moellendorffii TaxID=88036 RepID=UPI000D1C8CD4|nr:chloride channel protein CLC-e [Selaginella moellendorffii]|eukprot:XP_024520426.1 chloride channel protein CLC-e [Selaginella moellendorffii]